MSVYKVVDQQTGFVCHYSILQASTTVPEPTSLCLNANKPACNVILHPLRARASLSFLVKLSSGLGSQSDKRAIEDLGFIQGLWSLFPLNSVSA